VPKTFGHDSRTIGKDRESRLDYKQRQWEQPGLCTLVTSHESRSLFVWYIILKQTSSPIKKTSKQIEDYNYFIIYFISRKEDRFC